MKRTIQERKNDYPIIPNHSYNTRKRRREMMKHNMPVEVHIMLDYPTRRRRIQVNIETKIKPENVKSSRIYKNIFFGLIVLCWIWLLDEVHQEECLEMVYKLIDEGRKINWIGMWNIVRTYGIDAINTGYFMGLNAMSAIEDAMTIIQEKWYYTSEFLWLMKLNTDWTGMYISAVQYMYIAGMYLHFGVYVFIAIFMIKDV